MQIWAGLGNPGDKYALHRHNVGFMAVDIIAEVHDFGPWQKKFRSLVSEGRIGRHRILLLKPHTYMNDSGDAVQQALKFYKLDLDALTAFHDELDLAPFKVKVKTGGGLAGHNGLRAIDAVFGPDFRRVRIGIVKCRSSAGNRLPVSGGVDAGKRFFKLLPSLPRRFRQTLRQVRQQMLQQSKLIEQAIEKNDVGAIVIGLPLNLDGSEGRRAQSTRAFARNLAARITVPIVFWDERLSTAAVERHLIEADASRKRRAEVIDRMAAAYILQGALDRLKHLGR